MSAFVRAIKPAASVLRARLLRLQRRLHREDRNSNGTDLRHYNVLFLCTGNSARSIMAEAILNLKGTPDFKGFSAGSHPTGTVRPEALRELEIAHLPTAGLRSKSWEEFSSPERRRWTLCLRSAITPPRGLSHSGRDSR